MWSVISSLATIHLALEPNNLIRLILEKPEITAGSMGHLAGKESSFLSRFHAASNNETISTAYT